MKNGWRLLISSAKIAELQCFGQATVSKRASAGHDREG
jgi:hypothetical protein